MPAISADTMVLPRIAAMDPTAVDRPVLSVTTAPSDLEGEGFPVRRAFAGVDLAALDPFVHMIRWVRSSTLRASRRGPVAPAPRLRDRHLHDRRDSAASGLQRRWWAHHRRRHPVDDRRSGIVNF
jgi:hypothetical protein